MGERKGQNFYYPPDFDPAKHKNLNNYHGVHALRERANKIDQGILIIRFELPYNIWCGSNAEDPDPSIKGCRKHIGMGVRYNAEKTKIGMYYTTPVYQFKMTCHLCMNPIIIKTDPGNMDYVITQGARRVEQRWDPTGNGQVVPDDKRVGRKLADDAMFKLEHESGDKGKQSDSAPRIAQMYHIADRVKDDYMANRILRDTFRKAKKERAEAAATQDRLKAKAGIELDIVAERETDIRMARLLSLQAHCDAESRQTSARDCIDDQDIFATTVKVAENKKSLALHTLQKAAGSKQSTILKQKGFGILVKKLHKKDPESLVQCCSLVSPPTSSMGSPPTSSLVSPPTSTTQSTQTQSLDLEPCDGIKSQNSQNTPYSQNLQNPLSALVGDYGSSSSGSDSE